MIFRNLTPHALSVRNSVGELIEIPPTAPAARLAVHAVHIGTMAGFDVIKSEFGEVENLPRPIPGVAYIVSRFIVDALPDRDDLFAPGPAIRDDAGRVIGAEGLAR